jgi:hypothetical protein
MRFSRITGALVVLQTAAAHTVFTTLYVDDVNQGDGTCVRMGMKDPTSPVNDLTSTDMACGREGTRGVARVCPVKQGAKLSFEFRVWPDASEPGAIDAQHKGSCSVYMKNVASAINDTAAGDGWFKIWAEGYDESTSLWCTDKLIADNGILSVKIPDNLAGGNYLVRSEILALQEADKGNPQFYPGCAQIFLESTATTLPTNTVAIPGAVKITDPSATFNIYEPEKFPFPYPIPGPEPYIAGSFPSHEVAAVAKQSEGLPVPNTILTVANWMGVEVAPWTDSDGCDKSIEGCWAQTKTCYDTAPPTGGALCKILEDKCTAQREACPSNKIPNMGEDLTPKAANRFAIPPAANGQAVAALGSTSLLSASLTPAKLFSSSPTSSQTTTSKSSSTTQAGPLQPVQTQAPVNKVSAIPEDDSCESDNEEAVSTTSERQHPREISMVFVMHTSYRVTGTAAASAPSTPTDTPILVDTQSMPGVVTSPSASLGPSVLSTPTKASMTASAQSKPSTLTSSSASEKSSVLSTSALKEILITASAQNKPSSSASSSGGLEFSVLSTSAPKEVPITATAQSKPSISATSSDTLESSVLSTLTHPDLRSTRSPSAASTSTMTVTSSRPLISHTPVATSTLTITSSRLLTSQTPIATTSNKMTPAENSINNNPDLETNDSNVPAPSPSSVFTKPNLPITKSTTSAAESAASTSLSEMGTSDLHSELGISADGKCGPSTGETCTGSPYGNCCSGAGVCGNKMTHCGVGCQVGFGDCSERKLKVRGRWVR